MKQPVHKALAGLACAIRNCRNAGNTEWVEKHTRALESIMHQHAPSGSGFDAGTEIDLDACGDRQLRFTTSFHHLNETGFYNGWTDHTVTVKPNLLFGFTITVSGKNVNDIKEYVGEVFDIFMREEVDA